MSGGLGEGSVHSWMVRAGRGLGGPGDGGSPFAYGRWDPCRQISLCGADLLCRGKSGEERRSREKGRTPVVSHSPGFGVYPLPCGASPVPDLALPSQGLRPNPALLPGRVLAPRNMGHEIPGGTGCSGRGAWDTPSRQQVLTPNLAGAQGHGGRTLLPPAGFLGLPLGPSSWHFGSPIPLCPGREEGILGQESHSPRRDPVPGVTL